MRRVLKTPETLIFLVSIWIALACNAGYWQVIAASQPIGPILILGYFTSFLLLTIGLISLVLMLLAFGRATRIVLGLALVIAAGASYFTYRYGTLFDPGMLTNVIETDRAEAFELVNRPLLIIIALFGLAPAILIWWYPLRHRRLPVAVLHRSIGLVVALGLIIGPLIANQKEIFSVARNHQELRHMIAPVNVISASYVSIRDRLETPREYHQVALDATHANAEAQHRKPIVHVLIVGETARASNFSLNGYMLNTNPELGPKDDIRFLQAGSCGTATAVSLPCMFSLQEHDNFDREGSNSEDNLLDVASRSGYEVVWIDNGNGCKGICARVVNRDVHEMDLLDICPEGICYDEVLVEELRQLLPTITKDTLVVLHQLGSHGPAYFRRYPSGFRMFQPDCRSPNFGDCSQQEISNSYDNTIAYTDHVIAAAINELAARSGEFETSLVYVSDHGESLGEHNLYLHGMPYNLAPAEQTTVPMLIWLGGHASKQDQTLFTCIDGATAGAVSHDNLFHTELGLLGISTAAYKSDLDIFSRCRPGALNPAAG
jgi:lipid A ethanolaminephosphotransferase